jgi:1-acyl-sn-glycerol-3-phosphate acyltransferase
VKEAKRGARPRHLEALGGPGSSTPPRGSAPPRRSFPAAAEEAEAGETGQRGRSLSPLGEAMAGALTFLRARILGEYPIDPLGLDPELATRVVAPLARLLRTYFRVRVKGVAMVPEEGPCLLVANHSGTFPVDAVVIASCLYDKHPRRRIPRVLAADLAFRLPFVGELARKTGSTLACEEDARRLLEMGEAVLVFPEGYKGVGKGYRRRYRLQRFGRAGYIEVAAEMGVPVVPVAVVGAEEAYPMLGEMPLLGRLLGLPYFPVTPSFPWLGPLGLLPFPSKWVVEFGEPVDLGELSGRAREDPMALFEMSEKVKGTIQEMLYRNLMERGHPFL